MCAFHLLVKGSSPIEFLYIGANAGQQAMKAMGVMRQAVEEHPSIGKDIEVCFAPFRYQVPVKEEKQEFLRDAAVWRVVTIRKGPK